MRSLKTGLVTITLAGFVGLAAVVGCSADGTSDVTEDPGTPTDPAASQGTPLPPEPSGGSTSSSGSTGTKDGGKTKTDAGFDAGPPAPKPGDPCMKVDDVFTKSCGKCGKAQAICLGTDGGTGGKWSDYGACLNETGECVPGDSQQVDCGNCGKATKTCNNYCAWSTGSCTGQPTNSCAPGTVEYSAAGCTTSGTYRNRSCATTCTWSNYSDPCSEPAIANKLTISTSANGTVQGSYSLTNTQVSKREPTYTCGSSAYLSTETDHPYEIIEIINPTAKTAKVDIKVTTAAVDDSVLALYPTNLPPDTDADIKACTSADEEYDGSFPSLTGMTLPPNAKYIARMQSYYSTSSNFGGHTFTGSFTLQVKTISLQ